jgi:hypothetical protein
LVCAPELPIQPTWAAVGEPSPLNGRNPRTRHDAELLNAACQVAFGTA